MARNTYRFYSVNKNFTFYPKFNFLQYKDIIIALLNDFCKHDYKLNDLTPTYFIVETSTQLLSCSFNSDRNVADRYEYLQEDQKFLKKLFDLIPELKNNYVNADVFYNLSREKCYIVNDSFNLDTKVKYVKKISCKYKNKSNLKIYYNLQYDKEYYYVGDVYYKYIFGDEENCYNDDYDKQCGEYGYIYQKGYGDNLYLVHELHGNNSKIYNQYYFYDINSEMQFIQEIKLKKLEYKIVIDGKYYNVYKNSCLYEGAIDKWYEPPRFYSYDDAPDEVKFGYHGYGKYYNYDEIYEGQFCKGLYDGFGVLRNKESDKIIYEGKFSRGKYDGIGTLYDENGNKIYSGEWIDGERNGIGIEFNTDGSIKYSGNWYDDVTEEEYKRNQEYY